MQATIPYILLRHLGMTLCQIMIQKRKWIVKHLWTLVREYSKELIRSMYWIGFENLRIMNLNLYSGIALPAKINGNLLEFLILVRF